LDFTKSKAQIRLLPTISRDLFSRSKLHPLRCNIRAHPNTPTPLYNAAVLSDSTHSHFLTQIYNSTQSCSSLADASLLGRIWLGRRRFSGSYCGGGFGAFEWTWFVSHLLRGGGPNGRPVLDATFSSFQLFRGALNSIVMQDRVQADMVECIDIESGLNVFYKMTPLSYKSVYLCCERI
jgi:U3 small nucleolar RNA-associated protein 22